MRLLKRALSFVARLPKIVLVIGALAAVWLATSIFHLWRERADLLVLRKYARIEQRREYLVPFAQVLSSANQERFLPRRYIIEGVHFHPQAECPTKYLTGIALDSVREVVLTKSSLSPGDLDVLRDYPTLRSLKFRNCHFSSGTLRSLRQVTGLQKLLFENCRLAPDDAIVVSALPQLQSVGFNYTRCSDSFLNSFCDSPQLQKVNLFESLVSKDNIDTRFPASARQRMAISRDIFR